MRRNVGSSTTGFFVMPDIPKRPASPDDLSERDQFYHIFGKALAAWAEIEYGLSLWFTVLTNLEFEMGQNIFFSGRAFQTRSDALFAVLETTELSPEWHEFVIEAQNKALAYNAKRNRLAHGMMHPNALDDLGHPKDWRLKEIAEWTQSAGLSHADLVTMAANFRSLADILRYSFLTGANKGTPEEFLQRLRALPNEADSTQLSQKQTARLRQPQS